MSRDQAIGALLFLVVGWQAFGALLAVGSKLKPSTRVLTLITTSLMIAVELAAAFRLI